MNRSEVEEASELLKGVVADVIATSRAQLVLVVVATALLCVAIGVYFIGAWGRLATPIALSASFCGFGAVALGMRSSSRNDA